VVGVVSAVEETGDVVAGLVCGAGVTAGATVDGSDRDEVANSVDAPLHDTASAARMSDMSKLSLPLMSTVFPPVQRTTVQSTVLHPRHERTSPNPSAAVVARECCVPD
jgi:hypothetical protein